MTTDQLKKLVARAAELAVLPLDDLRSINPDCTGNSEWDTIRGSKAMERSGATRQELRKEYIDVILTDEYGHLADDYDPNE